MTDRPLAALARAVRRVSLALLVAVPAASSPPAAGTSALSLQERVEARIEVERLYHSWRTGTALPFDEAVPRSTVAGRVRRSLAMGAELERRWKVRISREMLAAELDRMERRSHSPGRLRRLLAALDGDRELAAEVLARPVLARRLIERLFAGDPSIHATARKAAATLRGDLISGAVDPWSPRPDRIVLSRHTLGRPPLSPARVDDPEAEDSGEPPGSRGGTSSAGLRRLLSGAPPEPGGVGELVETPREFRITVTLDITPGEESLALYSVPKQAFDQWWSGVAAGGLQGPPPEPPAAPPSPGALSGPAPGGCPVDDTWSGMDPNGGPPLARMAHSAVWTGAEMIVWGGWSGTSALATGGLYDPVLDTWTPTATTGAPEKRYWHGAAWTGSGMIVWGGADQGLYLLTGGIYDPVAGTWTATSLVNAPTERAAMASAWTGTRLLIWGGFDGTIFGLTYLGDGALYDPASDSWSPVSAAGAPSPRKPVSAWLGDRLLIWGGTDGLSYLLDGALYDPVSDTWTPTATAGAPSPRSDSTLVWSGAEALLWGGEDAAGPVGGGGAFDPASGTWRSLPITGGPGPRSLHAAVWTGDRMVVWGGWDGASLLQSGARYAPFLDSWTPTTLTGAPAPRNQHAAVWAADHMIVWGGWNGTSADGTGAGYEVADLDQDGLGTCDGDCDDTEASVYPGAPQICDGLNNDCAAPGWPVLDGTNEIDDDLDSFSECMGDCDDADPQIWAQPGEVVQLDFLGDAVTLQWSAPAAPGCTNLLYDTLRGDGAPDFGAGATCTASGTGGLTSTDPAVPAAGEALYYLVRGVNTCPAGNGSLGSSSDGTPRAGRDCP